MANCFLCGALLQAGQRKCLKPMEDELLCVRDILKRKYVFSEEDVGAFLSNGVICRRGKCQTKLAKTVRLRKELENLEREIIDKIGGLIVENGFVSSETGSSSADVVETTADVAQMVTESPHTPQVDSASETNSAGTSSYRQSLLFRTPKRNKKISRVSVLVYNNGKGRLYPLPPSLQSSGRCLGRRNRKSLVNQVMKDKKMRGMIMKKVGIVLQKEIKQLCRSGSCFSNKEISYLETFDWSAVAKEMQAVSPFLFTVLDTSVKKPPGLVRDIAVVFCTAVLVRTHSQRANSIQQLMSLLLYSSHAPKQLYSRLSKVGICLSHRTTTRLIDRIGIGFDASVKEWCSEITKHLWSDRLQVSANLDESPEVNMNTDSPEMCISLEESLAALVNEDESTGVREESDVEGSVAMSITLEDSVVPETEACHSESEMSVKSPSDVASSSSCITQPSFSDVSLLETSGTNDSILNERSPVIVNIPTFKIVGDNVDKYVKPRHETFDRHASSLHYFHSFAVKDRCNMSSFEDNPSLPDLASFSPDLILPNPSDYESLIDNYSVLAARIIQKHVPFFKKNVTKVVRHIPHIYSSAMSQPSEVVPLGVLYKNETCHEDMIDIMLHLQSYVPKNSTMEEVHNPATEEIFTIYNDQFHYTLLGGDQLTVERAVGSKKERSNESRGIERLEGFIPVIEDWHAKVALLKAIWKVLYKSSSGTDSCTLFHLRNLLMRRSVTMKIKSDPTACEEFFVLVLEAHILSIALSAFDLESLDDTPKSAIFSKENFLDASSSQRKEIFMSSVKELVSSNVYELVLGKGINENDKVLVYGKELLSLGMLYLEFSDAIKEGDGTRLLCCWKYLLLVFKATNKNKYAVQAATFLLQYNFVCTERMRNQLLWSRTINTSGRRGKNIPMDLHMEHLNRDLKGAIGHLSSNVNKTAIDRIAKSLYKLSIIKANFDKRSEIAEESSYQSTPPLSKDLKQVLDEVMKIDVFKERKGRKHSQFKGMKGNTVGKVKRDEIVMWLKDQFKRMIRTL